MQKYDNYIIVEAGDTLPNIARSLITTTSEDDDAAIESKIQRATSSWFVTKGV